MKQPDTAALRERLANYMSEEELKQDLQEFDGLLQEVNCQMVGLRNLLHEIRALKEELHGIHGSLKHTVIHAKVDDCELAKVNQCSAQHIKAEKKLLEEHSKELAKHLQKNEGIWLSSGWLRFTILTLAICCITVILWALYK